MVFENDKPINIRNFSHIDDGGPIVMETYTKESSYKAAINKIDRFNGKYGKTRIAKLVFIDEV